MFTDLLAFRIVSHIFSIYICIYITDIVNIILEWHMTITCVYTCMNVWMKDYRSTDSENKHWQGDKINGPRMSQYCVYTISSCHWQWQHPIWVPFHVPAVLYQIQRPASGLGKAEQGLEFLACCSHGELSKRSLAACWLWSGSPACCCGCLGGNLSLPLCF